MSKITCAGAFRSQHHHDLHLGSDSAVVPWGVRVCYACSTGRAACRRRERGAGHSRRYKSAAPWHTLFKMASFGVARTASLARCPDLGRRREDDELMIALSAQLKHLYHARSLGVLGGWGKQ